MDQTEAESVVRRATLDGEWTLYPVPPGETPILSPEDLGRVPLDPIPAVVPGNVELDLMRAGRIDDPYIGTNVYRLRDLEGYDWWYLREFDTPSQLPGGSVRLLFEGIDCLATVWLNGEELGATDNMLIPWSFDVADRLGTREPNTLAVHIASPVNAARDYVYEPWLTAVSTGFDHLFVRKAPHMYGWDIAPRIVTAGIWRSAALEVHGRDELVDVAYAVESIDSGTAVLKIGWQFRTDAVSLDGHELAVSGACGEHRFEHVFRPHFIAGELRLELADARLWWPKGYGEPNLYEVTWELKRDGAIVDVRTDTVGLRTVELERTELAGEPGAFLFRVNGEPVMCKGTNWVPLDAFHSRDATRYDRALELIDDLGCNIVRCWGGNVYEDHAFFAFCDRHGIMVWQDFAFACAIYPQDPAFLARVRLEAQTIVRRLRNHASLVLWAGDNEIDVGYLKRGLDPGKNRVSREVLPQVCAASDPYRPYLESSPFVATEVVRRKRRDQRLMPEQHLWGPRDYFKSPFYAENTASFASEVGYHGCPNVSSIRRFIEPDYLWPDARAAGRDSPWQGNDQWRAHATDPEPVQGPYADRIGLMANQIRELFGFYPENLSDFALASQISQAEAKKYFIEMFRLGRWKRTGIIWWNALDCWPQFSDAIVDYYFARKLAYWYIRRVQTPVCVMFEEPAAWTCRVAVANDTLESVCGSVEVVDAETDEVLVADRFAVEANVNREVGRVSVSRGEHRLFLVSWEIAGRRYGNHYLHGAPPVDLAWYRKLLPRIASLPGGFDPDAIAK